MKQGWEEQYFENCFKLKSGDNLIAKNMSKNGIYSVFGGNGIAGYHNEFNLSGSNVIIGRVGALCGNVRHITEKIWLTDNAFKIVDFKFDFDHSFLTYLLNFYDLRSYARQAAQPVISNSSLKDVVLRFPKSIKEQQRIVSILDEAFAAIAKAKANAEQNLNNAAALFESYLQGVFENKGDGWEEKIFEELIQENQIGLIKSTKEQRNDKPYRYLKMDSITSDNNLIHDKYVYVDADKSELEKFTLNDGDFLFNTRNSYELVGKTCVFTPIDDEPTLFNNNIMRVVFKKDISSRFINYAFSSELVKERLQKLKSGTTSVVGIYYKGLRNLKIPVTKYKEQQTIVRQLDALRAETQKLEAVYQKKIDDLEELKKSILQKAFNGELIEPAGELKTEKPLVL